MICTETTVIICFRAGHIFSFFFCIKIYIPQWWPFEDSYVQRFYRRLAATHYIQWFSPLDQGCKISRINSPYRFGQISLLWVEKYESQHHFICSSLSSCPPPMSPPNAVSSEVGQVYAWISLMIVKSTVFGNVFRRDTAFPWSMFTKLYPFAWRENEREQEVTTSLKTENFTLRITKLLPDWNKPGGFCLQAEES